MKVSIIGGGSFLWSYGFSRQFVDSQKLKNVHVTLMDKNPYALKLVGSAVEKYNKSKGSPVNFTLTGNIDSALEDSDFVIISISTGGLDAMKHDLEIPEKYGIWHTIGDTVVPGGLLRAVRNVPVFYFIAEKMT
jgi:alpha-galactosidase